MAVFALYFIFSPKNPFPSVARVIVPWSDLTAPTRVRIVEVTPGTTSIFRGKSLSVAAVIDGLAEGESPTLLYSTADQQIRDRAVSMPRGTDGKYAAVLPEPPAAGQAKPAVETAGLQQDIVYTILAGDARSQEFRVDVQAAPYIAVERIEYRFPAYTKLPPETRTDGGDVTALEGTTVIVRANANQAVKQAWIDLRGEKNKTKRIPLSAREQTASGQWTLGFADANKRSSPEFESYVLRFRANNGAENPEPLRHTIKVIRDEEPVVELLAPTSAEIAVPVDREITFEVRAFDPDFALTSVALVGMNGEAAAFRKNLAVFPANAAHAGNFTTKVKFTPADLRLKVGDVVNYYAEAIDNKVPAPNVKTTAERKLRVIESQTDPRNDKNDPLAKNDPDQNPQDPRNGGQNQAGDANNKEQPQPNAGDPRNADGDPSAKSRPNEQRGNPNRDQNPQDPTQRDPAQNPPGGQDQNPQDPALSGIQAKTTSVIRARTSKNSPRAIVRTNRRTMINGLVGKRTTIKNKTTNPAATAKVVRRNRARTARRSPVKTINKTASKTTRSGTTKNSPTAKRATPAAATRKMKTTARAAVNRRTRQRVAKVPAKAIRRPIKKTRPPRITTGNPTTRPARTTPAASRAARRRTARNRTPVDRKIGARSSTPTAPTTRPRPKRCSNTYATKGRRRRTRRRRGAIPLPPAVRTTSDRPTRSATRTTPTEKTRTARTPTGRTHRRTKESARTFPSKTANNRTAKLTPKTKTIRRTRTPAIPAARTTPLRMTRVKATLERTTPEKIQRAKTNPATMPRSRALLNNLRTTRPVTNPKPATPVAMNLRKTTPAKTNRAKTNRAKTRTTRRANNPATKRASRTRATSRSPV
ncbi:MAG: hypothetical protein QM811_08895 [Pirellulales bacterium]